MNIFFSSDFHYNQKNIVRGVSSWEKNRGKACRNFDTLDEHNHTLIDNINKTVKWDDTLYFLGDWSFGGIGSIWNFRKQLAVQKIHFIFGNHDEYIVENKILMNHPNQVRAQEIFTSCNHMFHGKVGGKKTGQRMTLCHYAMRTWHKAHHEAWHLYGHSHGSLADYDIDGIKFRCMDVGIDTHPEFRPYHFEEIKKIMEDRSPNEIDHHKQDND